jgi:5,10-methylene-tetrahydrofolate dehydrogenase/methenyl tetrahydrofolate cyclohydrolase
MVLIDGKATANQIKNEIAEEVKAITSKERACTTSWLLFLLEMMEPV